ncbi:M23 family metallopeptidase [Candidatus Uhrbacteria bacterium]|nr:M23 family metallopeptidase [Candidatus Uhrbacteria bacterium]
MKKLIVFLFFIGVSTWFVLSDTPLFTQSTNASTADFEEEEETIDAPIQTVEAYEIAEGDTFTSAMEVLGISYADALGIVESAIEVFDFTSIRVGKTFTLVQENDAPVELRYEPDMETLVRVDLHNGFETTSEEIEYEVVLAQADVVITDSLFASGVRQGLSEVLLLEYVDIFAWEVDFATQVQEGDSYTVLYEELYRDGEYVGVGDVLYGRFKNVGVESTAYAFTNAGGEEGYFDPNGDSLVRPFLKAPLSYSRITSGFSYARFHPVLNKTTPHRAIDYAAPLWTPVMAVADGTVTFAGWNGGYGNFIKVRHNGVYETHYAHLIDYEVGSGDQVKQGDVIGYVGSTGFSTGPHLHYEVAVNGELTDPLKVEFPKGDSVADEYRDAFEAEKERLDALVK